jgi:hypothetical protein
VLARALYLHGKVYDATSKAPGRCRVVGGAVPDNLTAPRRVDGGPLSRERSTVPRQLSQDSPEAKRITIVRRL